MGGTMKYTIFTIFLLIAGVWCVTLPPYWDETPGSLTDYKLINNVTIIDVWDYTQRQGLFKIILNVTENSIRKAGYGDSLFNHPLWGIPVQTGWQLSSGRAHAFTAVEWDNCEKLAYSKSELSKMGEDESPKHYHCLSAASWWNNINYYLTVVPFITALKQGYFDTWPHKIEILKPLTSSKFTLPADIFCISYEECIKVAPIGTLTWEAFFQYLHSIEIQNLNNRGFTPIVDEIQHLLWEAHEKAKDEAVELALKLGSLVMMPEEEASFCLDWVLIVNFIGKTRWISDLNSTAVQQELLMPWRVLQAGDSPPDIPDMSPETNLVLYMLHAIHQVNEGSGGWVLSMWKRAMCGPEGRSKGRFIVNEAFTKPLEAIEKLVSLIIYAITGSCE